MNPKTDTPLTDAAMIKRSCINDTPNSGADTGAKGFEYVVSVEVARQLERENARLTEILERAQHYFK